MPCERTCSAPSGKGKGEMMDGAFYAVARFLSRGYLWDNVRVVGGAYGGGCALNPSSGGFAFSSFRDPNLQGTLDIYGKTVSVLDEGRPRTRPRRPRSGGRAELEMAKLDFAEWPRRSHGSRSSSRVQSPTHNLPAGSRAQSPLASSPRGGSPMACSMSRGESPTTVKA